MRDHLLYAYCDKIADTIRKSLLKYDPDGIIGLVDGIKYDLHPTEGYLLTTKKTINLTDMDGRKYKVTIEQDD